MWPVPGGVSGSVPCGLSGSCRVSRRVSGSGPCDFVSGSGSYYLVSGSGSGSGHLVSDLPVERSQHDMGFRQRRVTAISNWGENDTQVLLWFRYCLAPGVIAGAGLANKLLELSALISWKQSNSLLAKR